MCSILKYKISKRNFDFSQKPCYNTSQMNEQRRPTELDRATQTREEKRELERAEFRVALQDLGRLIKEHVDFFLGSHRKRPQMEIGILMDEDGQMFISQDSPDAEGTE